LSPKVPTKAAAAARDKAAADKQAELTAARAFAQQRQRAIQGAGFLGAGRYATGAQARKFPISISISVRGWLTVHFSRWLAIFLVPLIIALTLFGLERWTNSRSERRARAELDAAERRALKREEEAEKRRGRRQLAEDSLAVLTNVHKNVQRMMYAGRDLKQAMMTIMRLVTERQRLGATPAGTALGARYEEWESKKEKADTERAESSRILQDASVDLNSDKIMLECLLGEETGAPLIAAIQQLLAKVHTIEEIENHQFNDCAREIFPLIKTVGKPLAVDLRLLTG
jgi:hypothetical protein